MDENFDEELERLRGDLTRRFQKEIEELKASFQQSIEALEQRIRLGGKTFNGCRICQQRPVTDPELSPVEKAWHLAGHPDAVNWSEVQK